jgi:hypothetical protein
MCWNCPACRSEVLHIVTHQLPNPAKTFRCQKCRLNLRFSWILRELTIASVQTASFSRLTAPEGAPLASKNPSIRQY